jgi:hypothetical protein
VFGVSGSVATVNCSLAMDVKAAVEALHTTLRSLRYKTSAKFDTELAETTSLLQALDHCLLRFSKHVALLVSQQGLQVTAHSPAARHRPDVAV